jgi:BlaI family transcriptional regulator, penicillinase repressor
LYRGKAVLANSFKIFVDTVITVVAYYVTTNVIRRNVMAQTPQISDSEWDVMKVVWEFGPLTSGDVVRRMEEGGTQWAPRTTKTLLGRLVKKGAVSSQESDGRVMYRAKVTREACVKRESRSFLARVFNGAVTPALVHFLEEAKLSGKDVAELRKILERGRQQ